MGPTGLNQTQNEVFCQFIESRSYIFLAYYDSLRQCLISRRDKTHEKKLCTQIWIKWVKVVPQIRFFAISSSLVDQFSFKFHRMIAWKNVVLLKKNGGPNFSPRGLNQAKKEVFAIFLSLDHTFLEIVYDDSLWQCFTSSRDKTR